MRFVPLHDMTACDAAAANSVLRSKVCGEAQECVVQLLRLGGDPPPPARDLICLHVWVRIYEPPRILQKPLAPTWAVPNAQSGGTMLLFNGEWPCCQREV